MKKFILRITCLLVLLSPFRASAALPPGSLAPDWTYTDIAGNSHHLYDYLNAGLTVYLEVDVAWCPPSWSYCNTHALRDLYTDHGPTGMSGVSAGTTNDVMVFMIETDGTTTLANLNGIGPSSDTQGDWVSETPFPIILLSSGIAGSFNATYGISYWPTIYMICPDRSIKEVGQIPAATLYSERSECAMMSYSDDAEIQSFYTAPDLGCDSALTSFSIVNIGSNTLTSAVITFEVDGVLQQTTGWTGSLPTYGNAPITGIKVIGSGAGTHTVRATVWNPNGITDPSAANNFKEIDFYQQDTVGVTPYAETFETGITSNWSILNGPDSTGWVLGDTGYSSLYSAKLNWYFSNVGWEDILIAKTVSFAGSASAPSLNFDVAYCQYSGENDRLYVEASTDCGSTWTILYSKAGNTLATRPALTTVFVPTSTSEWRHELVSLAAYAGMNDVLVRFRGVSAYGNNLYLDNVNFAGTVGIEENMNVGALSVYPNPSSGDFTVLLPEPAGMTDILELYSITGAKVYSQEIQAGQEEVEVRTKGLDNGVYFLHRTGIMDSGVQKVVINR
jgi:hypothetical protein